ncbi:PREDICTED: uncharacterized protein LOC109588620, partial [Amphimedon queenslandica]|uniref:Uncharacterized protein n=1 Tax=Amphimedon queenslandica TaxID=400682 RepID=A0A1X7TCX4_AMPQE
YLQDDTIYASTQSSVIEDQSIKQESGNEGELAQGQLARDSQQSDKLARDNDSARKGDQTGDVHVAGSKSFLIQNNLPQLLNWEEYGLRITVPEGAVSPSEINEVSITALVSGEFILPEDSELVSVVYIITVSKPLLKPVLLEIQHCVSIETPSHASYLSFVTSPSNQCPFDFQPVNKGSFPVGSRYGSLLISEFSSWAIVQTIKEWFKKLRHSSRQTTSDACVTIPLSSPTLPPSPHSLTGTDKSTSTDVETESHSTQNIDVLPASWFYFAQPLYENKSPGKKWLLIFLFGKDLNALIKYMNKKFKRAESDQEFSFQFERSNGFLEIHTDTDKCSEGWSISPHLGNPTNEESMENPTKVTKVSQSTIDAYGRMNPPCFPQCRFTITATTGSNTNPELRHPVTFKGIISENKVFLIVLSMGDHLMQDSVKQSCSTQQSQTDPKEVFREQYGALFDLMTPENIAAIANKLYSKRLITDDTLQDCMTDARRPADRAHSLLNALRVTIDQPGVLKKLIQVLKNNEAFRSIAEEMERDI